MRLSWRVGRLVRLALLTLLFEGLLVAIYLTSAELHDFRYIGF